MTFYRRPTTATAASLVAVPDSVKATHLEVADKPEIRLSVEAPTLGVPAGLDSVATAAASLADRDLTATHPLAGDLEGPVLEDPEDPEDLEGPVSEDPEDLVLAERDLSVADLKADRVATTDLLRNSLSPHQSIPRMEKLIWGIRASWRTWDLNN